MPKKVVLVNGGPRKMWNTGQLLQSYKEGAEAAGASIEYYNLYDLDFKGCTSCFACKRKQNPVSICVLHDDLLPVLQQIHDCDVLVLGSPIYWFEVTGETRSFFERLLYPCISYDSLPGQAGASRFGRSIRVMLFFTMGSPREAADKVGTTATLNRYEKLLSELLGVTEYRTAYETYQFDDYSKYRASRFNQDEMKLRHETVFAELKLEAFELGKKNAE